MYIYVIDRWSALYHLFELNPECRADAIGSDGQRLTNADNWRWMDVNSWICKLLKRLSKAHWLWASCLVVANRDSSSQNAQAPKLRYIIQKWTGAVRSEFIVILAPRTVTTTPRAPPKIIFWEVLSSLQSLGQHFEFRHPIQHVIL